MTKLKTLNEINTMIIGDVNKEDRDVTDYVNKHRLKQEVIKWIKKYFRLEKIRRPVVDLRYGSMYLEGKEDVVWSSKAFALMHFFNITSEELKEVLK